MRNPPRLSRIASLAAAATVVALGAAGAAQAADRSAGLYVIPFAPNTDVKITGDHLTHSPKNRIDMVGLDGGDRITAAAPGTIRFIQDGFSEKRPGGNPCNNNYVWIEHANGEWTKYSHMRKNSVGVDAGLDVGDTVQTGRFLGIQSDVGCASGKHLHFQVSVPANAASPIDSQGFMSGEDRIPRICGIPGQQFVKGTTYRTTGLVPGAAEYARHGVPESKYSQLFHEAADCGYRLAWIDGYTDSGQLEFNVVFRTNSDNRAWRSHSRMTGAQYQAKFDDYKAQGFRLTHVDSYVVSGNVQYAAIWEKTAGPSYVAYHGLTAAQHQDRLDDLKAQGFVPRVISPVSLNGSRRYTAIYQKLNAGGWEARSFLTPAEYQAKFDANTAAGRRLVYLNAYTHDGQPRITAIWWKSAPSVFAKHGLTSAQYQAQWSANLSAGRLTQAVTGYEQGGDVRFAAFWAN
jgi:hypothetical protein